MKTIKGWVCLKSFDPIRWEWWCYPFLNVKMLGLTKTPIGAQRAARRTIERLGYKAKVKIFRPTVLKAENSANVIK